MDGILERIGQLAVFLICAQTLIHFKAADSYEKYIKLLVSLMLLILLFKPLEVIFGTGITDDFTERIRTYERRLQEIVLDPKMQEEDIEVMLNSITEKKLQDGLEYAESMEKSTDRGEHTSPKQETEAVSVDIEAISVGKIELGGNNG